MEFVRESVIEHLEFVGKNNKQNYKIRSDYAAIWISAKINVQFLFSREIKKNHLKC